jgi:protein-S-isoprenylcysteine O-methyltransferase Ste14
MIRPVDLRWVHVAAFFAIIAAWFVFAGFFLFHKKPGKEKTTRAAAVSILGIVLQGVAYACVWMLQRTRFTPIVPLPGLLELVPPVAAVALTILSDWVAIASVGTLGKEWSLEARLVEGHRLVTAGPYRFVRHPIYSSMLGNLVATGLVVSHWIGLVAGLVFFAIGTGIRVVSEERLLRAQFGTEYEDYARRVPAILPRPLGF